MKHILITYLSTLPSLTHTDNGDIIMPVEYEVSNKIKFSTPYTNEAAIKYFKKTDKSLDRVIAVCSGKVSNNPSENFENKTAFQYFNECVKKLYPSCEINKVDISGTFQKADYTPIFEEIGTIPNDSIIYIDITGGLRDAVYTLSMISRFLEFKGAKVEDVIYSRMMDFNKQKNARKGKITLYTENFRLIDLINGMNEFINFGSAKTLKRYFSDCKNKSIENLISCMDKFTSTLSLCKSENIYSILEKLKDAINVFEKSNADNLDEYILKEMLPIINKKFFLNGNNSNYISIIGWCAENGFIQQALTIFIDKLPQYMFDKGFITITSEHEQVCRERMPARISYYAYILQDSLSNIYAENPIDKYIKFIKEIDRSPNFGLIDGYKCYISSTDFSEFLTAYCYFKFIRNEINHAGDADSFTASQLKFFKHYGYTYTMEADDLRTELLSALERIKNIKI